MSTPDTTIPIRQLNGAQKRKFWVFIKRHRPSLAKFILTDYRELRKALGVELRVSREDVRSALQ